MKNRGRKGIFRSCHEGSEFHSKCMRLYCIGSKEATEVLKLRNAMIKPLLQKQPSGS